MKTFKEFLAESQTNEQYFSQEKKKNLEPNVKKVLNKYGVKATLAVQNHSTFVVNIQSSKIDFWNSMSDKIKNNYKDREYIGVNTYWIKDHWKGEAQKFLLELKDAMMQGNHDNSDIQSDYFDVGWYIDINIGTWKKPYQLIK